jgi:hypothetical protein
MNDDDPVGQGKTVKEEVEGQAMILGWGCIMFIITSLVILVIIFVR